MLWGDWRVCTFEPLRLPLDKISCTRQFESKLSLRSFAKSLAKRSFVEELGITEEIKWQKVNEYWYEKYLTLVDFIFDLLAQGYIKIRIFFRNNQYTASYLTREQRHKAYFVILSIYQACFWFPIF